MIKKAKLVVDDHEMELQINHSKMGADALMMENLYKEMGVFSLDRSAMSTAICKSEITYIDGLKGILQYRGYCIDDLAKKANFIEVCYLLLNVEKPSKAELVTFEKKISQFSTVDDALYNVIKSFDKTMHPMAMLAACVLNLASRYKENNFTNAEQCNEVAIDVVAKMPILIAAIYRHVNNLEFIKSDLDLSYNENFLNMMFGDKFGANRMKIADFMDKIFILHADHGQNASTFAVRAVGTTKTNPMACLASGVCSLWGTSHGGANEAVIKMLKEIDDINKIPEIIERVKNPDDPFLLMGFGHRIYKNFDPRAKVLQGISQEILSVTNDQTNQHLFEIAVELEKIALSDEYFIKRKLYPNVDFYSGIILSAIGIPSVMFTPIFALSRTIGWISHWKEMILDKEMKIFRPRQVYVGYDKRDY